MSDDVAAWAPTIESRLAARQRRTAPAEADVRHASVCVCLIDRPSGPQVLIIKRVPRGRNAGQWALPGGKRDGAESDVECALRELHEEVGLEPAAVKVLGVLDDFVATSGFVITPVVVAAPGRLRMRRNPDEVSSLNPIPFSRLLSPEVPRWRETPDGPLLQMPLRHDMVIHAPTGAILWQFAEVALRGRELSSADVREPDWTRH